MSSLLRNARILGKTLSGPLKDLAGKRRTRKDLYRLPTGEFIPYDEKLQERLVRAADNLIYNKKLSRKQAYELLAKVAEGNRYSPEEAIAFTNPEVQKKLSSIAMKASKPNKNEEVMRLAMEERDAMNRNTIVGTDNSAGVLSDTEEALVDYAAKLTNLAYYPKKSISSVVPSIEEKSVTRLFDRRKNVDCGFVAFDYMKEIIVISFRGTDDLEDAITDADFPPTEKITVFNGETLPIPLYCHGGFMYRFLELSPDVIVGIEKIFTENKERVYPILVTGHSLGGALATICAFVLGEILPDSIKIQLISFEAPRAFTKETMEALLSYPRTLEIDREGIRIAARWDVVPHVPLYIQGFRHMGRYFHIAHPIGHGLYLNPKTQGWSVHSMQNIEDFMKFYKQHTRSQEDKKEFLTHLEGRGKGRKRKGLKRGSAAARARMAYVRSFKKP